jgi:hypothetical protein
VFKSANPDFFIAHLDVSKAAERPEVLGLWRDFVQAWILFRKFGIEMMGHRFSSLPMRY